MYYKLTTQDMTTYGDFQWKIGEWYRIPDEDRGSSGLCTSSWFHCYGSPYLAAILNRRHARIANPRMFIANVKGAKVSGKVSFGFTMMRLNKEIEYPKLTICDLVNIALLCAQYLPRKEPVQELSDEIAEYALVNIEPADSFRLYRNTETLPRLCESLIIKCALSMSVLPILRKYMRSYDRSKLIVC